MLREKAARQAFVQPLTHFFFQLIEPMRRGQRHTEKIMKKILFALMFATSLCCSTAAAIGQTSSSINHHIAQGNYCPPDETCLATNITATSTTSSNDTITGVSILQEGSRYVAIVPGHGRLTLYFNSEANGWCFNANDKEYKVNWQPR